MLLLRGCVFGPKLGADSERVADRHRRQLRIVLLGELACQL